MKPSEMAFLIKFQVAKPKELPNRPTNNGDMSDKFKRPVSE